jgi:hypothetical protein
LLEDVSAHKHGLVARGHTGAARSQIDHEADDAQHWVGVIDLHIKTAPVRTSVKLSERIEARIGQAGIGMQKKQPAAPRPGGTGIHLRRPTPRREQSQIGQLSGYLPAVVLTAAVDHDQLSPRTPPG